MFLSLKDLQGCSGEGTASLHAISKSNKTVALLREPAMATLPFSPASYTDTALTSVETVEPYLANSASLPEPVFSMCARVTFSVAPTLARHALLMRNVESGAAVTHLLTSTPSDIDAALKKAEETPDLWRAARSAKNVDVHVFLMSESAVPSTMSSSLNDLPLAAAPHQDSGVTVRVLLGNSTTELVAGLQSLFSSLLNGDGALLSGTEVCWPPQLPFPVNVHTRDAARRKTEHAALLLPNKPLLHHQNALQQWETLDDLRRQRPSNSAPNFRAGEAWERHLVTNPHTELPATSAPSLPGAETLLTSGSYDYYHYRVDGFRDDGWGCAYRSLQTVLSWFQHEGHMTAPVPSLRRIQEILYATDPDKANKKNFVGSCDWIGSFEIMLVLQHYMPGLDCTIRRLESGKDLDSDPSVQLLLSEHFRHPHAAPVMIGGSSYAHTILGIHVNVNTMEARYLVLDPHYSANPTQLKTAIKKGFVGWKEASKFFEAGSWYNLCVPRTDLYDPR